MYLFKLHNLIRKKTNDLKEAKDLYRHLAKENLWMAHKGMKWCSASRVIGEMQTNTQMLQWLQLKQNEQYQVLASTWRNETLVYCCWVKSLAVS